MPGLECGILGSRYPHLDMVSFWPHHFGVHTAPTNGPLSLLWPNIGTGSQEALKRIPEHA